MPKRITTAAEENRCSTCMLNAICLPLGMTKHDMAKLDQYIKDRVRLKKGASLFHEGESADVVYGLRTGSIKTQIEDANGQVQITGFSLPGEVLGLDGLMHNHQVTHAIALEDSELCIIRLSEIDKLGEQIPSIQMHLRRLMSKEIARSHQMLLTLGSLRSEQRLAAFLLNLSQRLQTLGYSPYEFILRMSREEIGNFLGLTLETVSRLFSRFSKEGLIKVRQREVIILDINGLHILSGAVNNQAQA